MRQKHSLSQRFRKLKGHLLPALITLSISTACVLRLHRSDRYDLLISDVTVVAADGRLLKNQSVLIAGGQIAAIGENVPATSAARVVDGSGRFLIPGLWDMHAHLQAIGTEGLPLLVANGVLGVRDMGSDLDFVLGLRRRAIDDPTLPSVRAAGPIIDDAPETWPFRLRLPSPRGAEALVRKLREAGVDFIKVHARLSRESWLATAAAARAQGLPLAGHLADGVSTTEAVKAGLASLEHLGEFRIIFECAGEPQATLMMMAAAYSATKCQQLFTLFREHRMWQTPTLGMLRMYGLTPEEAERELQNSGQLQHATPTLLAFWKQSESLSPPPPVEIRHALVALVDRARTVVADMQKSGVGLLAGCDALVPGRCLHRVLELMVESGLTPAEALRTATMHPAAFLGEAERRGSVEPGKMADLLLLDANPLADIRNLSRIQAVVSRGLLLDREALDRMLR